MTKNLYKKILVSLSILIITLISLSPYVEDISYKYHNDAFELSLATFAIAKGLNGIISVLQGTEVQGSVLIASATFTVGEILDPLNDLIERFSWVMLASTIALGIEKLFIEMGSTEALKYIILGFATSSLFVVWIKKLDIFRDYVLRGFFIFLILRLSMPLLEGTNQLIYENFTNVKYQKATQVLKISSIELEKIQKNVVKEELSILDNFQKRFENTSKQVISMMVIFVLHTILLPMFFLWGSLKMIIYFLKSRIYINNRGS